MLYATEVLGAEVHDAGGNYVGRVKELFIEPADQPNRVAKILLGRGRYQPLVARYDQIADASPGSVRLTVDELALDAYRPNEAWLAIRKDLLDQQIIDTNGRKVVRVNDIDLDNQRTNGTMELRVVQVDAGLQGAARRLLQGLISPALIRRLQQRLPDTRLPWEFVNLIEGDRLRRVKLRISSEKLAHIHPADLADIVEELSPSERHSVIDSLDDEKAAETLVEMDDRLKTQVLENLGTEKAGDILEEMSPDEAADLLQDLSPETSRQLLNELPQGDAKEVRALLQFEESSAGGMMNTDFVFVGETAEREEVIDWIRKQEVNPQQFDTILLVNKLAEYAGAVAVGRLLLSSPGVKMSALAAEPLVSVRPDAEDKEVFELFDKYDLRTLGVVDEYGHPIGVITVDDVVSALRRG
jgi:magnesium transporter